MWTVSLPRGYSGYFNEYFNVMTGDTSPEVTSAEVTSAEVTPLTNVGHFASAEVTPLTNVGHFAAKVKRPTLSFDQRWSLYR